MIWLVLCILANTLLYIILKLFAKFRIDNLQAIVVNYLVAGTLGYTLAGANNIHFSFYSILDADWIPFAVFLGLLFISIFYLMALSAQLAGISATSVANKMSVVIPVLFGLFFMNESTGIIKITGIFLALVAVYLTSKKQDNKSKGSLLFPVIIFFGSGVLDTLLGYVNAKFIDSGSALLFTATIFSVAAILGLSSVTTLLLTRKKQLKFRNIIAGICLGIPNFGSIYFLFKGLDATGMQNSEFFPILNMGVVALSAVSGFFIFRERLSLINLGGILIAIAAIGLIAM